ncbi:hypothetical protein M408DRAFT_234735 [Serendipita vermifera MAFF 305830]|uniref:Uncharacterized protein n=1 Tax=Serendipita vermifera MAFF 305830 TaxID=933852 RepID=A0A0C2X4Q6_SERVB|nr:hypothetical protein M408DRAFT_234735 [Serendipita vermifera MAFF 305830]
MFLGTLKPSFLTTMEVVLRLPELYPIAPVHYTKPKVLGCSSACPGSHPSAFAYNLLLFVQLIRNTKKRREKNDGSTDTRDGLGNGAKKDVDKRKQETRE